MGIEISGASDDLIEVEGDIREEFYLHDNEDGDLIAVSDGTVLRIAYTQDGIWRITPLVRGSSALTIEQAVSADDDNYSDRAILSDATWVVHGIGWAK